MLLPRTILALSLAAVPAVHTFAAAPDQSGYATRPAAANKAERNDAASLDALFTALNDAGIAVGADTTTPAIATVCAAKPGLNAWFKPIPSAHNKGAKTGFIAFCMNRINETQLDADQILRHEAAHVMQWCKSGKPDTEAKVRPLGLKLTELTRLGLAHAVINDYGPNQLVLEAEAESLAQTTSLLGMAKSVKSHCK
mgnify:CR=1 FL=1